MNKRNITLDKKRIPAGYNTLNPFVIIKGDAKKFIEFVEKIFDAEERRNVRTPDRDGTLIHAELRIGSSSVLIADSKSDWPFTPAFLQVYVEDAQEVLKRAKENGAEIVTEVSKFYGGFKLARFKDAWGNLWWLYEPEENKDKKPEESKSDLSWHDRKPSYTYTSLMEVMKNLGK